MKCNILTVKHLSFYYRFNLCALSRFYSTKNTVVFLYLLPYPYPPNIFYSIPIALLLNLPTATYTLIFLVGLFLP